MNKYCVLIGRWYGVWRWIWYADIIHEEEDFAYMTFNAFSRRGALRKARRYLNKLPDAGHVYVYDETDKSLEEMSIHAV